MSETFLVTYDLIKTKLSSFVCVLKIIYRAVLQLLLQLRCHICGRNQEKNYHRPFDRKCRPITDANQVKHFSVLFLQLT